MDTDINIKALTKLGKALAGLADAVEIIDALETSKRKLEADVAAVKKSLAELVEDAGKVKSDVAHAKADAKAAVEKAKRQADEVRIKADMDAQEVVKAAQKLLDDATDQVKAAEARKTEIELDVAAKAEAVAALAKQEADILGRIAAEKAKLLKALE